MLKGLFGWGKRAAPQTVRETAAPAPPIAAARPGAAHPDPAPTLAHPVAPVSGREPGELLGGVYPVLRRLGEGGFGEVFLCRHSAWNIEVAVKLPKPEALAVLRAAPQHTSKCGSFSISAHRFVLRAAKSHSTMAVTVVQHA